MDAWTAASLVISVKRLPFISRTVNRSAVRKVSLSEVARSVMALMASRSVLARLTTITLLFVVEGVLLIGTCLELGLVPLFTRASADILKEPAYTVSSKVRRRRPKFKSSENDRRTGLDLSETNALACSACPFGISTTSFELVSSIAAAEIVR